MEIRPSRASWADLTREVCDEHALSVVRVGIEFPFFDNSWLGGVKALANLISALQSLDRRRIEPVLIAGKRTPNELLQGFGNVAVLRTNLVDTAHWSNWVGRVCRRVLGRNFPLEAWLRWHALAVYSHCSPLGKGSGVPTIGHVADFGYKYFRELYPPDTFAKKDEGMARICDEHDFLLLSSLAVQDDYRRFFPSASAQSFILNITPTTIPEQRYTKKDITAKHSIPDTYIFCPNQFWVHKNHGLILDALSIAKTRGKFIHVVCTGRQLDERRPQHFSSLLARRRELGLEQQFHTLGILPYQDVTDLMRHSAAVLSASLFEGWGMSVTEGNFLGKMVVLSDIPVFREQAPARAHYFDPKDANALADILSSVISSHSPAADENYAKVAKEQWAERVKSYALTYEDIVIAAANRRRVSAAI